ncbi:hypothetical protein [Paraglaciecola sp. 2405UD69-4]|uniref:hypothetical protein n=1 Tax=Paraglaciecola sp. 2405UD69-4 TaxID=3391836 RepID=UPI0039C8E25B
MLTNKMKIIILFLMGSVIYPVTATELITFSAAIENNHARIVCEQKLSLALDNIGYRLRVKLMPAARSLVMSNEGVTSGDVARMRGLTSEYANLLQLEVPCFEHSVYFYVKPGKEFIVDGWASIPQEYLLGYRKGIKFIESASKKYNFNIYPIDNLDQSVAMIMAERIDLLVGSTTLFKALSNQNDGYKMIRLEPAIENHEFYPYIHKKHKNLIPELTTQLIAVNELELDSFRN